MLKLEKAEYLGTSVHSFAGDGFVVNETEYRHKVFEGWHCHENHHITFIARGGNREQRRHRELQACPGRILAYNSGELHRNTHTQHPSRNINLEIEAAFLQSQGLDFAQLNAGRLQEPGIRSAILKIYSESRLADAVAPAAIQALVLQVFGSLSAQREPGALPPWTGRLRALLHDRWNENLSLHELSAQLQVHPVTISKYFPRYFSCTLGDYMRMVKIEKAMELIRHTKQPLTAVAYQCGFFDQSHFIKAFKTVTGFLPREYRQF